MKNALMAFATILLLTSARADAAATVCIAGRFGADGAVTLVSGNPAQVAVLENGNITLHTLIDAFSLYNTHYNRSQPFDMSLVTALGSAGTYTTAGTAVTARWMMLAGAESRTEGKLELDMSTLVGKLSTDEQVMYNGGWTWGMATEDRIECTTAGIR